MDWIVFGDDWGGHPSTTQHLILNLPPEDRVIWVDSIGMRSPGIRVTDAARIWQKARGFLEPVRAMDRLYPGTIGTLERLRPKVLPWHLNPLALRWNARWLGAALSARLDRLGMRDPVLLSSSPVAVQYLHAIPHRKAGYLRLDDYSLYPGVDPELVFRTEQAMFSAADAVFATATSLMPPALYAAKAHYLPQGVQSDLFGQVPLDPPRTKVLGFFGTVAEWLDFELIEQVARSAPDWVLEFIGKVDVFPETLRSLTNLKLRPAMPLRDLPAAIAHWSAAWIPFQINDLTLAVNPLKVREYLAAGLPTQCTPLPEVAALSPHVTICDEADRVVHWMQCSLGTDTPEARRRRRAFVAPDSWSARAATLRRILQ